MEPSPLATLAAIPVAMLAVLEAGLVVMPAFDPAAHPALVDLGAHLRELAGDASYQAGRDYLRKGRVQQGAVAGTTAYATVTGSSQYRVSVAFGGDAGQVKVSCTCPAARRNRYCKHVVAVSAALLERPGDFVVGEAPPEVQAPPKRGSRGSRAAGGAGGAEAARPAKAAAPTAGALRTAGLETVDKLLAELASGGLISLGPDKLALLAGAGDLVRALKLRRLGNLLLRLQRAAEQRGPQAALDERSFAHLMTDLWLTRRATGAALEGRGQLDESAAEDLLGTTWRDDDLERTGDLELMEVAFQRQDDGEFRIETSYLADLDSGALYAERQITPLRLYSAGKPRHRHRLLVEAAGLYPGSPGGAPRRLKLLRVQRAPLRASDVARFLACVPDRLEALHAALVAHLATPFGPPELVVAFRPQALLARSAEPGAPGPPQSGERTGPTGPALPPGAARIVGDAAPQSLAAADADGHLLALERVPGWVQHLAAQGPPAGSYALVGLLRLAGDASGELALRCLAAVSPGLPWMEAPVMSEE